MGMTTQFEDWEWDEKNIAVKTPDSTTGVSTNKELKPSDFIEGGTTLILSGPARADTLSSEWAKLIPIGMLDNVSVSQQKNVQQIFEIGSKLAHIVPGRTMGQLQLGRVFFDGDSLMKALYSGSESPVTVAEEAAKGATTDASGTVTAASVSKTTSGRFAANLASSYFDQPHGLCFMFKSQNGKEVSTIYFEDCMINSHQFSINAQANIIQEGASIMFRRIVPLDVDSEYDSSSKS